MFESVNPNLFLLPLWLIFAGYWAVTSIGIKKDVKRSGSVWLALAIRLAIVVVLLMFLGSPAMKRLWESARSYSPSPSAPLVLTGLVLCASGIGFAIWARIHIGRNWSPVPAMKEEHELVTSGPYRYVRHPIYTGILVAMIGSALVAGLSWLVVFLFALVTFLFRVRIEEGYMMKLFPIEYPEYRKRVKALIPFVA